MQRENGHPECNMKVLQISCHLTIHLPFWAILVSLRFVVLDIKLNTIFLSARERQAAFGVLFLLLFLLLLIILLQWT